MMTKLLRELRHLVFRRHVREVLFAYATVSSGDRLAVARALVRLIRRGPEEAGREVQMLEAELAARLGTRHVVTFDSGRTAFRAILEAMGIGSGDRVAMPAFTCVVVPFAVRHCGARPVYVDIGLDYRMEPAALAATLATGVRAVVMQHTFGIPERAGQIVAAARMAGAAVIEDCAHVMGVEFEGRQLGSFGDAAYFSFDSTKPITAGWGGAAATSDDRLAARLRALRVTEHGGRGQETVAGLRLLLGSLLYHPATVWVGRWIYGALARLGVLPIAIPPSQRRGEAPEWPPRRLAGVQAALVRRQLGRLAQINRRRGETGRLLRRELGGPLLDIEGLPDDQPLLRYPVWVDDRSRLVETFRAHQIELGQWFQAPLHPADSDFARAGYTSGSCPQAERISKASANLPTFMTDHDLARVVELARRHIPHRPVPVVGPSAAAAVGAAASEGVR